MYILFYINENLERVGILHDLSDIHQTFSPPALYGSFLSYILNLDLYHLMNNILTPSREKIEAKAVVICAEPKSVRNNIIRGEELEFLRENFPLLTGFYKDLFHTSFEYLSSKMKLIYDYIDLCIEDDFYYSYDFFLTITNGECFKLEHLPEIILYDDEQKNTPDIYDIRGFMRRKKIEHTRIKNIDDIKKYRKSIAENKNILHAYRLNDIFAACVVCLLELFRNNFKIKKCVNCGKYFVPPYRADTKYCSGIAPQDNAKTCQEYGSYKAWSDNLKNDESAKKYRNTYMKLQLLVKRNPEIQTYKNKFEEYKTLSKQWKLDIKNNVKTKEEYLNWINTY